MKGLIGWLVLKAGHLEDNKNPALIGGVFKYYVFYK